MMESLNPDALAITVAALLTQAGALDGVDTALITAAFGGTVPHPFDWVDLLTHAAQFVEDPILRGELDAEIGNTESLVFPAFQTFFAMTFSHAGTPDINQMSTMVDAVELAVSGVECVFGNVLVTRFDLRHFKRADDYHLDVLGHFLVDRLPQQQKIVWWTSLPHWGEYRAAMTEVGILRGYLPCVIDLTGYPGSGDETETESDGGDGA
jgi:hypothetical protein